MPNDLLPGIVRILRPDGTTSGTGFLATKDGLIVTCTHVILAQGQAPPEKISLIFQETGEKGEATVESWQEQSREDVAILRLKGDVPAGAQILLMGSSGGTSGHRFKTYGFPDARSVEGMWGYGTLGDSVPNQSGLSFIQLTGATEISPGFSGGPVLDLSTRRVVGMVDAILAPDRYGRLSETAFIVPAEILKTVSLDLDISDVKPYRGLDAFSEEDAEFFFGRQNIIEKLLNSLRREPRFLTVLGPSGSGKSSVIRAGLIPKIIQGALPGSEHWGIIVARPMDDPFKQLTIGGLKEEFLVRAVDRWLKENPDRTKLVLVFDQFEEILTSVAETRRQDFFLQLSRLLRADLPLVTILVMRDDFYSRFANDAPEMMTWLEMGLLNIPLALEKDEIRAIVQGPAEAVGLSFEPGLVDAIVSDVMETAPAPGERAIRSTILPLLEFALTQLWERRQGGVLTHKAYKDLGGVTGSLTQWADKAYQKLAKDGQGDLARRILTELVSLGDESQGHPDSRLRKSLKSLIRDESEKEAVNGVVQSLSDALLLSTFQGNVEIIHDSLIREWGLLQRWLKEDRRFLIWRQELDERASAWSKTAPYDISKREDGRLLRGRDLAEAEGWLAQRVSDLTQEEKGYIQTSISLREKENEARKRLRRNIMAGLAIGLAVTTILAVFAGFQWQQADQQKELALSRQLAAQAELMRTQQASLLQRSAIFAVESLKRVYSLEADRTLRMALALLPHYVSSIPHEDWVTAAVFSPDGKYIATASRDNTSKIGDTISGKVIAILPHVDRVKALAFSQNGEYLATGSRDGDLHLWDAISGMEIWSVKLNNTTNAVAFSPDGRFIGTGSSDGIVGLWDARSGHKVREMEHQDAVRSIVFSPGGKYMATASDDGTARIWDAFSGDETANLPHDNKVKIAVFSPDGRYLATGGDDNTAHLWNVPSGIEVTNFTHTDSVNSIAFSPDSKYLAVASENHQVVRVLDIETKKEAARMFHEMGVSKVIFSPDGKFIATASFDKTARVWDAFKGWERARMTHEGYVIDVNFSPDGKYIATASADNTAKIWDIDRIREVSRLDSDGYVEAIDFSPDGKYLATASLDGEAYIWDAISGRKIFSNRSTGSVIDIAFTPDAKYLVTSGDDHAAHIWDIINNSKVLRLNHSGLVATVAISPDGKFIATASDDKSACLWDAKNGTNLGRIEHNSYVNDINFSPDGKYIVTGSADGTARIWDLSRGSIIANLTHGDWVNMAIFSRDGKYIATASDDLTASLWNATNGQKLLTLNHNDTVNSVAFSPDGKYIATGSDDNTACLWDATSGKQLASMAHGNRVWDVVFSPDGNYLATASDDNTARMWDVSSGKEVLLVLHNNGVKEVRFTPDGKYLATASDDGTARVWLAYQPDPVLEVCSCIARNLNHEEWKQSLACEPYLKSCPNLD
jgi:WD40 repeat protein